MKKFTQLRKYGTTPFKKAAATIMTLGLAFVIPMPAAAANLIAMADKGAGMAGQIIGTLAFVMCAFPALNLLAQRSFLKAGGLFIAGAIFAAVMMMPGTFLSIGQNIMTFLLG